MLNKHLLGVSKMEIIKLTMVYLLCIFTRITHFIFPAPLEVSTIIILFYREDTFTETLSELSDLPKV